MSHLTGIFLAILAASFRAAVVILVIYALRGAFFRRLSPRFRYALWGAAALALMIPACWSLPILPPETLVSGESSGETAAASDVLPPLAPQFTPRTPLESGTFHSASPSLPDGRGVAEKSASGGRGAAETTRISLMQGVVLLGAGVWIMGVGVTTLLLARRLLICRRWRVSGKSVIDPEIVAVYAEACRVSGVNRPPRLLVSSGVPSPALTGLLTPALLIPNDLAESLARTRLYHIFLHELAHYRRRDLWTGAAAACFLALHWFNPLLRWALQAMAMDREEACDVLALEKIEKDQRYDYAFTLYELLRRRAAWPLIPGMAGMMTVRKQIERRLDMMDKIGTWKKRAAIVPLVILTAVSVMTLAKLTEAEQEAPQTAASASAPKLVPVPDESDPDQGKVILVDPVAAAERLAQEVVNNLPQQKNADDMAIESLWKRLQSFQEANQTTPVAVSDEQINQTKRELFEQLNKKEQKPEYEIAILTLAEQRLRRYEELRNKKVIPEEQWDEEKIEYQKTVESFGDKRHFAQEEKKTSQSYPLAPIPSEALSHTIHQLETQYQIAPEKLGYFNLTNAILLYGNEEEQSAMSQAMEQLRALGPALLDSKYGPFLPRRNKKRPFFNRTRSG